MPPSRREGENIPQGLSPTEELSQLGTRLQELQQSLGKGGNFAETYRKFEQAFQEYTSSLIKLIRNPFNFSLFADRYQYMFPTIILQSEENNYSDYTNIPRGKYSIELFPGENFFRFVCAVDEGHYEPDQLNVIFPSITGSIFVRGKDRKYPADVYVYNAWSRALEPSDLLNSIKIGNRKTIMDMFMEGSKAIIDKISQNTLWQSTTMQEGIQQMNIQELVGEAINPQSELYNGRPLTEAQINEIVDRAIREHPVIKNLEARVSLNEKQIALLGDTLRVIVEEHQPGQITRPDRQVDQRQIEQEVRRVAPNSQQEQETIIEFIKARLKGARDPERVFRAIMRLVDAFVPGAHQAVAIIGALDDLFGPGNDY